MQTEQLKCTSILGYPVCSATFNQLMAQVSQDILNQEKRLIVAVNPEKILKARQETDLDVLLKQADYPIADGIGILWAAKMYRKPIAERITGIDCMQRLCLEAGLKGHRVFLYGARPQIVQQAKEALEKQYPQIQITGIQDGYEQDDDVVVQRINDAGADIVFVALGSPRQEYWIQRNMQRVNACIFQGVGGSFDVLSGDLRRAPEFFLSHGLEWFYRLWQQPGRIFRQIKLLKFVFWVWYEKINQ